MIEETVALHGLDTGSPTFKNITLGWIDVRDVANAHILAYENASANGRYILVERVIHHSQAVQILRDLYPTLPLPDKWVYLFS